MTRTCKACDQILPVDAFYQTNAYGTLDAKCKPCRRAHVKARRLANLESVAATKRAYYLRNADAIKATARARYEADPEAHRAQRRAEHQRHFERDSSYMKTWRQNNPEKVVAYSTARRARKKGAPVYEIIDRAAIIARDGSRCHICRELCGPDDIHLDHLVPLSKGGEHTARNLAVAHANCNRRRSAGRIPAQLRLIG